jgi:uncharacterized delta-60 repeat protein
LQNSHSDHLTNHQTMRVILLTVMLSALFSRDVRAQAGQPDSSFASDGVALPFGHGWLISTVVQPDGKILASGSIYDNTTDQFVSCVIRLLPGGSPDTAFGVNGMALFEVGIHNYGFFLALQPDGRIVLAGTCFDYTGKYSFGLTRLLPDGTLDTGFGIGGEVITGFSQQGLSDFCLAVTLQPDGKIVAAGYATLPNGVHTFAATRYYTNGLLDPTFGVFGRVVLPIGDALGAYPAAVRVQPDGKVVLAGYRYGGSSETCMVLARLNADGTPDDAFGTDGIVTCLGAEGDTALDEANDVIVQPDGKILIIGSGGVPTDTFRSVVIARYNLDGSLDTTFGTSGIAKAHIPDRGDSGNKALLQPDGKIVTGGFSIGFGWETKMMSVARFNSDGTLDGSFGMNGFTLIQLGVNLVETSAVAMQPDGKIIAVGSFDTLPGPASVDKMFVVRLLSGLNPDISDTSDSYTASVWVYPNPITESLVFDYTLTEAHAVTITLIDMKGSTIRTPVDGQTRFAGAHSETIDLSGLASGVYLLDFFNGSDHQVVRIAKH